MKQGKLHWVLILTVAAILLLANRSHAYYTNYLDSVSNALTVAYDQATPPTNAVQRREAAALLRALKTLARPSTSVAGDYNLFLAAALQLGPLINDPTFFALGSNVFNVFTNEAQVEINATANRIAALNSFVRTKRGASNNLAQAQAALNSISSLTDPRLGLIVGRLVFAKIVVANRLAAIGEARSGFARNDLIGKNLVHTERGDTGTIFFNNDVQATQDTLLDTMYTYTRTGLNTATLVLVEDEGGDISTTTVQLRFTSASGGTFTFRNVTDGDVETGRGTFTISD